MTSRGRTVRHAIHHTRHIREVPAIFGRTSTHAARHALDEQWATGSEGSIGGDIRDYLHKAEPVPVAEEG